MPYAIYATQDFDEAESNRILRAIETLSTYLEAAVKYQEEHPPKPDSPIGLTTKENGGRWWFETGELPLAASVDHLGAFVTLLRGPVPRQAGYSVMCGSVEASAIAWWLFDTMATEQQRVQRGFEERLHGIHTQRGLFPHALDSIKERQAALVAEAAKLGLNEQEDTQSQGLTTFGRPRLGINDLLLRMLPTTPPDATQTQGEVLWRTLSAWSHSELWTNMVGLSTVEDDSEPRELSVNIPVLMAMCRLTVEAFDAAFNRRMQLAGHMTWERDRGGLPTF